MGIHWLGALAATLCIMHFVWAAADRTMYTSLGGKGLYAFAYACWVGFFGYQFYSIDSPPKVRMGMFAKFLACLFLLIKGVLLFPYNLNTRFIDMTASMLFLLSSFLFSDEDTSKHVCAKIGSTILLSCSLAAIKGLQNADHRGSDEEWIEFNVTLAIAFLFLGLSTVIERRSVDKRLYWGKWKKTTKEDVEIKKHLIEETVTATLKQLQNPSKSSA